MATRKGLGKGLDALFLDNAAPESRAAVETVKLSEIEPNRGQPRKNFNEEAITELAESIREHGLLQPLLIRPMPGGRYQLLAGERRWRASRRAGLTEVPVIIREVDDKEAAEIALIENLQRENLNPMEEALGYEELMEKYALTQEEVARAVGKSRPAIANTLRLLHLPEAIRPYVERGELSAGHARALLAIEGEEEQLRLAKEVVSKGLTVRDIERASQRSAKKSSEKGSAVGGADHYLKEMQLSLVEHTGRSIKVKPKGKGGVLEIPFFDQEDLRALADRLTKES